MVQPGTAFVFGESGAEETHLAHGEDRRAIETLMAEIVAHAGKKLCLAETARIVAHHALFFGERLVEKKRIGPIERRICHVLPPFTPDLRETSRRRPCRCDRRQSNDGCALARSRSAHRERRLPAVPEGRSYRPPRRKPPALS